MRQTVARATGTLGSTNRDAARRLAPAPTPFSRLGTQRMPLDPQQPVGPSPERPIEWAVSASPVDYPAAVAFMEQRAKLIAEGRAHELVWLCEHPPLYTAGTSAKPQDL